MSFDQHSPAMGTPATQRPSLGGRSLSNWLQTLRIKLAFPIDKQNLALDLTERALVLIFFLYFANKMLPRLSTLIVVEIAHPELLLLAATTNLEAALLVTSELLGILLILTRRSATIVSRHPRPPQAHCLP